MKQELEDFLCEYLGELLCESEATIDWIAKDEITRKINAVNVLLGSPVEISTTMEKILNVFKK